MTNIIHDKNYISKQKKLYFLLSIFSAIVLITFYIVYKVFFPKIHLILAFAALCSIPLAQFSIRFSLFWGINDCNEKIADEISTLSENCLIINNALITNGKNNVFIDNIIISKNNIICIINPDCKASKGHSELITSLIESKRIPFNLYTINVNEYSLDKIKKHISHIDFDTEDILSILKGFLI